MGGRGEQMRKEMAVGRCWTDDWSPGVSVSCRGDWNPSAGMALSVPNLGMERS